MKFAFIIPLYNRPDELDELLQSLVNQTSDNFSVTVVEDGSEKTGENVIKKYTEKLTINYYKKDNSGPGLTRNYGAERTEADYLIFVDSDCIIPPQYIETVDIETSKSNCDAFGGPDASLSSFTPVQKAIGYAMTSFFTTGGIRGGGEKAEKFHPRSFNTGIKKSVFRALDGYSDMRFGEDIDFSIRIMEAGYKTQLIKSAFVYHKRRTDFKKFFKQIFNSGCARINLYKRHKNSLKLVHFLPAAFLSGNIFVITAAVVLGLIFNVQIGLMCLTPLFLYALLIFTDSTIKNGFKTGLLSMPAAWIQLCGYGAGFFKAVAMRLILKKQSDTTGFVKNFYK